MLAFFRSFLVTAVKIVTQECSCEHWPKGAKDHAAEAQKFHYSLVAKRLEKHLLLYGSLAVLPFATLLQRT